MRVAILHNPRPAAGDPDDDRFEEYDPPATIAAIAEVLAAAGAQALPLAADPGYPWRLHEGRFDLVFNLAEGSGGRCREAVPAAVCECLGLAYTGSDPLTLAVTLDKALARRIVAPEVPVAAAVLVADAADEDGLAALPFPVIVKPNHEGSSKGIRDDAVCTDAASARARCRALRERYAQPALVEAFLPGAEVTVAVRGEGRGARLIGMMEVAPADDADRARFVYGLEAKREFRTRVRYHVPPRLDRTTSERIAALALDAYRRLGCRDIARLDFRLDGRGAPHFVECNPLPGLNPETSDLVILARALADDPARAYAGLVDGIVDDALRRLHREPLR